MNSGATFTSQKCTNVHSFLDIFTNQNSVFSEINVESPVVERPKCNSSDALHLERAVPFTKESCGFIISFNPTNSPTHRLIDEKTEAQRSSMTFLTEITQPASSDIPDAENAGLLLHVVINRSGLCINIDQFVCL